MDERTLGSRARRVSAVIFLVAVSALTAGAQSATFAGAVVRDTLSHGIPEAVVEIPQLQRTSVADARGEFRMTGLPSGRYAAVIRRIGFVPLVDTIELVNGASVDREYVMDPTPTVLDSIRINAVAAPKHLTAGLAQFEEHRKLGFGYFLTEADLRKFEARKLNDVITSRIPMIRTYQPYPKTMPHVEYLSSGGNPMHPYCPVTLLLNGVVYFSNGKNAEVPDIAQFATKDLVAVEYYSGAATIPVQYNFTESSCGLLALWTRQQ